MKVDHLIPSHPPKKKTKNGKSMALVVLPLNNTNNQEFKN